MFYAFNFLVDKQLAFAHVSVDRASTSHRAVQEDVLHMSQAMFVRE